MFKNKFRGINLSECHVSDMYIVDLMYFGKSLAISFFRRISGSDTPSWVFYLTRSQNNFYILLFLDFFKTVTTWDVRLCPSTAGISLCCKVLLRSSVCLEIRSPTTAKDKFKSCHYSRHSSDPCYHLGVFHLSCRDYFHSSSNSS